MSSLTRVPAGEAHTRWRHARRTPKPHGLVPGAGRQLGAILCTTAGQNPTKMLLKCLEFRARGRIPGHGMKQEFHGNEPAETQRRQECGPRAHQRQVVLSALVEARTVPLGCHFTEVTGCYGKRRQARTPQNLSKWTLFHGNPPSSVRQRG